MTMPRDSCTDSLQHDLQPVNGPSACVQLSENLLHLFGCHEKSEDHQREDDEESEMHGGSRGSVYICRNLL